MNDIKVNQTRRSRFPPPDFDTWTRDFGRPRKFSHLEGVFIEFSDFFSPSSPWSDISVFKVLSNLSELVWLLLVWILGRVSIPDLRVRIRQRDGVMFSVGFHTCFTNAHTKSIIFLWTSPIKICVIIKKKTPKNKLLNAQNCQVINFVFMGPNCWAPNHDSSNQDKLWS